MNDPKQTRDQDQKQDRRHENQDRRHENDVSRKKQREDQPLKQMNDDPDEAHQSGAANKHADTKSAAKRTQPDDRRNAQGDHAGSAHNPGEFEGTDPVLRDKGQKRD